VCVWGLGLECTGPDTPRGTTAELTLTFTDATPLVDIAYTGLVSAAAVPGTGTSFSLTTVSAPARYSVVTEQLTSAPGSTLDTWVTVTNTGRTTGREVAIALDLPGGLSSTDAKWSACSNGSGDLCRTIRALAPGASERAHVSFAATSGSYPLALAVRDAAGVTASASTTITVGAEPAVVGVAAPAEIVLERDVPATVSATVTNAGGSTATGVVLRVDLPAGVEWVPGAGCAGRSGSNQALECQVGTLVAGASRTVAFQVETEGDGASGKDVVFTALWDIPGSSDDALSEEVRTPVRVVTQAPAVRVALDPKTTFVRGSARDVVATVTNAGTATATGLTATFQLPADTSWQGAAAGSVWACTPTGGGSTVTCTTPSLAAGSQVELAGRIQANGTQAGRLVTLELTWTGGETVTAQTEVVMGSLPACAPAWRKGTFYRVGDPVSFESWNYTRLIDFTAIYEPGRFEAFWRSEGACA
jgi:hypothetical protein